MSEPRTFTQEQLDHIVNERLERQARNFKPPNLDDDPEIQALRAETQAAQEARAAGEASARKAKIRLEATRAGILSDARIARLCALVPTDAEDIGAAVKAVLMDIPELAAPEGAGLSPVEAAARWARTHLA